MTFFGCFLFLWRRLMILSLVVLLLVNTCGAVFEMNDEQPDWLETLTMASNMPSAKRAKIEEEQDTPQAEVPTSNDCPICLEPLVGFSRVLPCSHVLHEFCLYELAHFGSSGAYCPLCRAQTVLKHEIASLPVHVICL
jgi:hypothetical protein